MLIFHGHWGRAIRTGSVGIPTDEAQRIFQIVEDMHTAMLDGLRPGADLRAVGQAGIASGLQLGEQFQFRGGSCSRSQLRGSYRVGRISPTLRSNRKGARRAPPR